MIKLKLRNLDYKIALRMNLQFYLLLISAKQGITPALVLSITFKRQIVLLLSYR